MVLVSCVKNELAEPVETDSVLAAVEAQAQAVEASAEQIEGLQELVKTSGVDLTAAAESMKSHAKALSAGASLEDGSLATLELQSELASIIGSVQAELYRADALDSDAEKLFASFEKGVRSWLGGLLVENYSVAVVQAKVAVIAADLSKEIHDQELHLEALVSDVQAGLRKDADPAALAGLSASLTSRSDELVSFSSDVAATASEVNEKYAAAIRMAVSDPEAVKTADIKTLNENAEAELQNVDNTLSGLAEDVAECKEKLAQLQTKLEILEDSIEGLLGLVQSVTFLSEYSEEKAIAYYEMGAEKVSAPGKPYDGKCVRTPVETVELSYMVRPAAAAAGIVKDAVSVEGYYAGKIQPRAVDPSNFINFNVTDVAVTDSELGIVTVKLAHDLKDDFYYREIGAKCALFIAAGSSDITSKFVELYPKDKSSTVYVEGIKINTDDFEIDEGQSKNLAVTVNPSSATNKTVTWSSSNDEIASVNPSTGVLTALKQGSVKITATANGVDEWGDNPSASVNVTVNASIRLGGPLYVEVDKTAELSLDFPPAMNIESKVWMSSDETKATVENGIVTGVADSYNTYTHDYIPVTITCLVNGNITLTHVMKVVVPQPKHIKFNGYADDEDSISMKVDETISLAATILPENVDQSKFRLQYQSDGGLGWVNFDTGEIKNPGAPMSRYVYVDVVNKGDEHYFLSSLRRTVAVNVEPYYVKTMSFAQESMKLAPDQTAVLAPEFTSDVTGKQPTYTDLAWVSSDPSTVSVDEKTGEITTHKPGSAVVTATTSNPNSVPAGQSQKSASCTIVVETPVAPVNVGDYFYSDGTWSTQRDYSKTVIGIVFSNTGAAMSDSQLMKDCPTATHGLVVGLAEYSSALGQFGYSSVYGWLTDRGYPAHSTEVPNGYGLTKGMSAYRDANSGYVELYDKSSGPLAKHKVSLPSGVSSWYIPSYKEMKWMHENKAAVNASLSNAGGTQITGSMYWSSTLRTYNSYNDCQGSPFDMINGGWYAYDKKTDAYPVRVVFAF